MTAALNKIGKKWMLQGEDSANHTLLVLFRPTLWAGVVFTQYYDEGSRMLLAAHHPPPAVTAGGRKVAPYQSVKLGGDVLVEVRAARLLRLRVLLPHLSGGVMNHPNGCCGNAVHQLAALGAQWGGWLAIGGQSCHRTTPSASNASPPTVTWFATPSPMLALVCVVPRL